MKPLTALVILLTLSACGANFGGSYHQIPGAYYADGRPIMVSGGAPPDSRVGLAIAHRRAQAEASRSAAEFRYWRGRILRHLR